MQELLEILKAAYAQALDGDLSTIHHTIDKAMGVAERHIAAEKAT